MKGRTFDLARGKWRGILQTLGVDGRFLTGKHGPCPKCEGVDRFRWDNSGGNGSYICGQCGAGDGFDLLRLVHGWSFKEAAAEVDAVLGNVTTLDMPKPKMDEEKRRKLLIEVWGRSLPIAGGDLVDMYLLARGIQPKAYPDALRFAPSCMAPDGNKYPAMLARVVGVDGKGMTIHRTFLGIGAKADIAQPRALMPGSIEDGACVRLSPVCDHIGIAEGIETALGATQLFGIPTWAAINSTMMAKWSAPDGVRRVTVFSDNDSKFGGQSAAYTLAHKLSLKGIAVDVQMPSQMGRDWADEAHGRQVA